jgi:hypothetical protein
MTHNANRRRVPQPVLRQNLVRLARDHPASARHGHELIDAGQSDLQLVSATTYCPNGLAMG